MINVDFDKKVEHTLTFDEMQIKDILIEALRITGVDIPDSADVECDDSLTFDVKLTFSQEELNEYLAEKAEAEAEPEATTEGHHWSTDAEEVNAEASCSDCPAEEK